MIQPFNRESDKIAISLKRFKLLKKPSMFGRYFEPYIISFVVDANGRTDPEIEISAYPFTKFRVGQEKNFLGQGRLIYEPRNPGEYVAFGILFMESEAKTREVATTIGEIMQRNESKVLLKSLLLARPDLTGAMAVVHQAASLATSYLEKQKDEELFFTEGALLRDTAPPFDIDTTTIDGNDFVECEIAVIPLQPSENEIYESVPRGWNYTQRIRL